jgi:hypothetical protein
LLFRLSTDTIVDSKLLFEFNDLSVFDVPYMVFCFVFIVVFSPELFVDLLPEL